MAALRHDDDGEAGGNPDLELSRCAGDGQQAHDQAEIVVGDVDKLALVDVLPPAPPRPAHASSVEHQREAALDVSAATRPIARRRDGQALSASAQHQGMSSSR